MKEDGGEGPMGIDRWSRALSWHAALREADERELTNSLGREWQDWYADAENRRVFDDVSRLLTDRDHYRKRCRRRRAELESDSYDLSMPIAEWRRARALQERWKPCSSGANERWLFGGIGIAAIAVLIALWALPVRFARGPSSVVYQTNVAVVKDVHLPDGSSIILGGRTELSVAFSAHRRSVNVIEGQAWFKVAHASHWPFVVTAGDGTIADIGTAFLVTRDSDRVVVTVTDGAVEVSAGELVRPRQPHKQELAPSPASAPIRVSRGEQVSFNDYGALSPIKLTDTRAATAWTHGRLTFDDQPLRYVVEAVNRYSPRHIVVSPSAGALRFSGIVYDDQIGDWLQSLEIILPVTIEESRATARIRTRDSMPAINQLPAKAQP